MSYEGSEQHICMNGHYYTCNASGYYNDTPDCPICKSVSVWCNSIDETNCDGLGYIPEDTLKEKFLISAAEYKTCDLGHPHQTKEAIYRIPTQAETKPLRTWRDSDIEGSLYLLTDLEIDSSSDDIPNPKRIGITFPAK